jgi:very-short-patch-repair endonuclease
MGIITKEVEVRLNSNNVEYYKELGYEIPMKRASASYYKKTGKEFVCDFSKSINVKVSDLPTCSPALIETLCDYCGESKQPIRYVDYNIETKNGSLKCCCLNCSPLKQRETMIEKYGCESPLQVFEIKSKVYETNLKKYGFVNPSKNAEVKGKQRKTMIDKYGVEYASQSKEILEKIKQTNLERYGVENYSQTSECHEKIKQTCLSKYGVKHHAQLQETKDKRMRTNLERYGVENYSQTLEFLEKSQQTFLERYGVNNVAQNEEIKKKIRDTNLQKYGVEYSLQSPEVRAKINETLCKNGTQKTSKQQLYLHSLFGGEINYPIGYYAADICFPEEKIVVEYDGGGHNLRVVLGLLSQKEFDRKEIIRNVFLKKEGYKQIKIISRQDLLPPDEILLQMLSDAKCYFENTPHSWVKYDVDNSLLFNAEHKDGALYDYGALRTIKHI